MKFVYADETGAPDQGDVFVMVGVLIDAYRLRKYTAKFDEMVVAFLERHPGTPKELKTKNFINGDGGWSKVDAEERKKFLSQICSLVTECAKVFGIALSFAGFNEAAKASYEQPFGADYWLGSALFVAALVQKKMQTERGNKGLTVFICDDNKQGMANFSDALYEAHTWFDPIYRRSTRKRGETVWEDIAENERFDQIVNCAFAIKSQHSSLIQIADAVSYVYRRHLELKTEAEAWSGEKRYFGELADKLDSKRERLGHTPGGTCIDFYKAASHAEWTL